MPLRGPPGAECIVAQDSDAGFAGALFGAAIGPVGVVDDALTEHDQAGMVSDTSE